MSSDKTPLDEAIFAFYCDWTNKRIGFEEGLKKLIDAEIERRTKDNTK